MIVPALSATLVPSPPTVEFEAVKLEKVVAPVCSTWIAINAPDTGAVESAYTNPFCPSEDSMDPFIFWSERF